MNTELYEAWKQSHRAGDKSPDMAEVVMRRVGEMSSPDPFRQARQALLSHMREARAWARAGMLSLGALLGALRLLFQIYSLLFS